MRERNPSEGARFHPRLRAFVLSTVTGLILTVGCGSDVESGTIGLDANPTLGAEVVSGDSSSESDWVDPAGVADDQAMLSFNATPVFCCNPLSIEFVADLSVRAGVSAAAFEWDFGDGRSAYGPEVRHTYAWSGEYVAVLRAHLTDGTEFVHEQILSLRTDWTSQPDGLRVFAGPDQSVFSGNDVTLIGQVLYGDGEAEYAWTQTSGPHVDLDGVDTLTASFTAADHDGTDPLILVFTLTAIDAEYIASDDARVTVYRSSASEGVNAPPSAIDQWVSIAQDMSIALVLSGIDPDGDDLTFRIVTPPQGGSLSPVHPVDPWSARWIYTPMEGFFGLDVLTFTATDGLASSLPGTVSIDVVLSEWTLAADARDYLVPVSTPTALSLTGHGEVDRDLAFELSSPPLHGTLGPIEKNSPKSALVTYTPDSEFEGTDTFAFRVLDADAESQPAVVTLTVHKLLIPWMEVNSPRSEASLLFTAEQGAEPGMTRLDYCLAGLDSWSKVTDTVIITTQPSQIEHLYPELMRRKPPHVRVIGGIKTASLLGIAAGDTPSDYFASSDAWRSIALSVQEVARLTGVNTVVLENETALGPWVHGEASIDLHTLEASLAPLADTNTLTWWWLPWVMSNNAEEFPDRQAQSIEFVSTVERAVPRGTFLAEYAAWYGWRSWNGVIQRRSIMAELVGDARLQDGLFVTPNGYVQLPDGPKRAYTSIEALNEIPTLPGNMVRIYPGGANWVLVADEFAQHLPPLGDVVR